MAEFKLAIIGAGNMAKAMLEGILRAGLLPAESMMVTNRSVGKLEILSEYCCIRTSYDNGEAAQFGDVIVLAVKPSDLRVACQQLQPHLRVDQLVISVAAGATVETIKRWLGRHDQPVARAMPNTPAQIGLGMTGWIASQEVRPLQRETARQILAVLGREIEFQDEAALDMVTAISGSGPAYVFYLAEVLAQAGREIGLGEQESQELVLQTLYGAAAMLRANGKSAAELRSAVTSKGGTTEAALQEFQRGGLAATIQRGVQAAHRRGQELGRI
jgi:pyrroline-5-carboxylate reductase